MLGFSSEQEEKNREIEEDNDKDQRIMGFFFFLKLWNIIYCNEKNLVPKRCGQKEPQTSHEKDNGYCSENQNRMENCPRNRIRLNLEL